MNPEIIQFADNNSTCRGCMNTNVDQLENLFSGQFLDFYQLLTSLTISFDDGLPTAICILCKEQLEYFHLFRMQCIRTHELLEAKLELKIKIENDLSSLSDSLPQVDQKSKIFSSENTFDETANSYRLESHKDCNQIEPEIKICTSQTLPTDCINQGKKVDLLTCNRCGKRFKQIRYLQSHMKTHFDELKIFQCDICSKSFLKLCHLKKHIISRHTTQEKRYSCETCGRKFLSESGLSGHKITHLDILPHKCNICPKTFASVKALKFHLKIHDNHKPYLCAICARRFNQASHLQFHMFTHTGERPYVCKICTKAFSQPSTLKEHIAIVHNKTNTINSLICKICSKTFNNTRSLRNHFTRHSNTKRYACDICSKTFFESSKLKRHRFTHSNDRRFTCPYCAKCLSRSDHLKNHIRKHHEKETKPIFFAGSEFNTASRSNKNELEQKQSNIITHQNEYEMKVKDKFASTANTTATSLSIEPIQEFISQSMDAHVNFT